MTAGGRAQSGRLAREGSGALVLTFISAGRGLAACGPRLHAACIEHSLDVQLLAAGVMRGAMLSVSHGTVSSAKGPCWPSAGLEARSEVCGFTELYVL